MIRKLLFAIAGVAAIQSLWLIVPELIRPGLAYFPQSPTQAEAAARASGRADAAAWLALIRGDLWTEAAVADTAQFAFESAMADQSRTGHIFSYSERSSAERAASWSPHDARAWLLLAATNLPPAGSDVRVVEGLKLSYFTGPNETELMPLRLAVVTRSRVANDPDIALFARQDLQTVLNRLQNQRPAVIQAYKNASPEGRKFLNAALAQLDPTLLQSLGGPALAPRK